MPRRRLAPVQDTTSHHLARRFLQLDTDIRLAAAAGGIFPISQDDRPESPVRQYPWDAEIQHPRPRPAHGPIRIRQLENVAKTKPKPTRSVSDPGDAHRLIAHFVRSNETKARSNTVAVSDPSPASSVPSSSVQSTRETGRAFPFPSMTRHSTLGVLPVFVCSIWSHVFYCYFSPPFFCWDGWLLDMHGDLATRSCLVRNTPSSGIGRSRWA
ncbi:hypothetical protein FRC08_004569 [Ceratobasidium sp. 394]|nr:hypothetical protein FRC08_004569 [Ceratobasidium sp. 394]